MRIGKEFLALAFVLVMVAGLLPVTASAAEGDVAYAVEGGNIYFDPATGAITDADSGVTAADIPAEINGVAVTSIGKNAFSSCTSLTSVTIPSSVTSIDYLAFAGCTSLASVTIPSSVTSIGQMAFYGCTSLTSIAIPSSVTSIDYFAFAGCTSLASVTIPSSVTSVGYSAFDDCTSLESVTISEGVTSIWSSMFSGCTSLTSVTIPEGVTSIGDDAFSGCISLESITIPSSVTSIGAGAFRYCGLLSVAIPRGVESIGEDAFSYCLSVTIPEGVNVGEPSFDVLVYKHNKHHFSVRTDAPIMPDVKLSQTIIDKSNEIVGSETDEYKKLELIHNWVASNIAYDWDMYYDRSSRSQSAEAVLESRLAVCEGYSNLAQQLSLAQGIPCYKIIGLALGLSMPNSWNETASDYNWSSCDDVDEINHAWNEAYVNGRWVVFDTTWDDFDYSLISFSSMHLIVEDNYSPAYERIALEGGTVTFYRATESISDYNGEASSLVIPSAFNGVSVTSIGNYAFMNCDSLTSVTIPESVTEIGEYAFRGCSSLTDVYYGGSEAEWNAIDFGGYNDYLLDATIHYNSPMPEPTTPTDPEPTLPATVTAKYANMTFLVNGESVSLEVYNIDGNNYFKLRDLAQLVSGTAKQFNVVWDDTIRNIDLISNTAYAPVGGELAGGDGIDKTGTLNASPIFKDGESVTLAAYTINGNNYFKLRDLCKLFDIGVTWDATTRTVGIDTSIGYTE